ncbi:MAG: hypothetical protein HEQ32_08630 [Vampirovibrio sp.]
MSQNSFLPPRPMDPRMYAQAPQGSMPMASPYADPMMGQANMAYHPSQQGYPNYDPRTMAQGQMGYQASPFMGSNPNYASTFRNPAYVERRPAPPPANSEAQALLDNTLTGATVAGGVGVAVGAATQLIQDPHDFSHPRQYKDASQKLHHVILEEGDLALHQQASNWFSRNPTKGSPRVARINDMTITYGAKDTPKKAVQDLGNGAKATYHFDGNELILQHVSKGGRTYNLAQLEQAGQFDATTFEALERKVAGPAPKKKLWLFPTKQSKKYDKAVKKLEALQDTHALTQGLGDHLTPVMDLMNTAPKLPTSLSTVAREAQMASTIDWADAGKKILQKGGIGALLGAVLLGGGTLAFQQFQRNQAREAQTAQQSNRSMPGLNRPPQAG